MKKIIFTILFSFSLLLGQKVWWVDMHNGNDSNDGTSAAKAFKTIHKVLESNSYLTSGQVDTIKVMPSVNSDNPNGYYDFKNDELYTYNSRDFILIGVEGAEKTILDAQELVNEIYIDSKISDYILNIVFATREPDKFRLSKLSDLITFGASPRASINLVLASKAKAFIDGRGYVIPEDVKYVAKDILRHRILLSYEAEAEEISSEDIIDQLLQEIPVP